MPDEHELGNANGFAVEEDPEGGFRWSAFGAAGARQGHADSQADAVAAARQAEQELNRPASAGD
jgi:hypothetical protein